MKIEDINTELLTHHPDNPRTGYGNLDELTKSIKEKGILQPLTVVKNGVKYYNVVAGNRRLEAAKAAGLKSCPCIVTDMNEKEQAAVMLIENMQRRNLTPYEEAKGVQICLDLGISETDLAKKTGFSKETIRHRKKLAELDQEKLKKKCADGQINMQDLIKIEQVKDPENKNKLLESIGTRDFDYNLERMIERQEALENMTKARLKLDDFAEEMPADWRDTNYTTVDWCIKSDDFEIPDDADTRNYCYRLGYDGATYFMLLGEKVETEDDDEDQDAGPSEYDLRREASEKLEKEGETIKKLHIKFMEQADNLPAETIIKWLICLFADDDDIDTDEYKANYTSVSWKLYEEVSSHEHTNILKEEGNRLLREATKFIYAALENGDRCPYTTWQGEYTEDRQADTLYAFLEQLGYKMSSSEQFIRCGTHTAFYTKDEDDDE